MNLSLTITFSLGYTEELWGTMASKPGSLVPCHRAWGATVLGMIPATYLLDLEVSGPRDKARLKMSHG